MKKNKGDFITIVFAVILIVIIVTIAVLAIRESNQKPTQLDENTPVVTTAVIPQPTPTTVLNPNEPPIKYDKAAQETLLKKIVDRKPLTINDARVKATILATLPKENPSGILYRSERIIIDYTNSANMFQVEITTTDIPTAKAEANVWFRARGMSQRGICDLPLMFYLNSAVMEDLRGTGYIFNPLANSC